MTAGGHVRCADDNKADDDDGGGCGGYDDDDDDDANDGNGDGRAGRTCGARRCD